MVQVCVKSDQVQAGRSEDGSPVIDEVFYVSVTFPNGRRIQHCERFRSLERAESEEGETFFSWAGDEAQAKAQRLANRVDAALRAGRDLDPTMWDESRPEYGSDEYVASDAELETIAWERANG